MTSASVLPPENSSPINSSAYHYKSCLDEYLSYEKKKGFLLNDKYFFMFNLQTGSFGKVSCAFNVRTKTKVAIKAMKKSAPGISFMARHEVSIMKKVGAHPNMCQLIESFETRKYIIIVLEYADSGDLYDAIHNSTELGRSFKNDPASFASLVSQLTDVISFAHSKGIYHRDIKPENVLLMVDGSIKLCDWGLATSALKCRDFNVGTEKYMAPEALTSIDGADHYDARKADIWSLGITLLFTLFGKCPFRKAKSSDINYLNFEKSKDFLYDYYPDLNSVAFDSIVQEFLVKRSLSAGVNIVLSDGVNKGMTVEQEYQLIDSKKHNDNLGGDFFMFDFEQEQDEPKYLFLDGDDSVDARVPVTIDEEPSYSISKNTSKKPIEIGKPVNPVYEKPSASSFTPASTSLFDHRPSLFSANNNADSFMPTSKSWFDEGFFPKGVETVSSTNNKTVEITGGFNIAETQFRFC